MAQIEVGFVTNVGDIEENITSLSRSLRDAKLAFKDLEKGTEEYAAAKADIAAMTNELNKNKDALEDLETAGSNTVNAFKELKNKLRDATAALAGLTEGTPEFIAQSAVVGGLRDQINGLNDAIANTSGAPVENLTGSFGLLSGQLSNLDFEGATTSLKQFGSAAGQIKLKELGKSLEEFGKVALSVGKAILLNPLFLIPALIIGIGAALYALKDKIKPIGDFFDAIGKEVAKTIQTLKDFGDLIGLTSFKEDEAAEKALKANALKKQSIVDYYDQELKLAKASGKNAEELFKIEQKRAAAVKENIKQQIHDLVLLTLQQGKSINDIKKELDEFSKQLKTAYNEDEVALATSEKEKADKRKKAYEERIAADKAGRKQLSELQIAAIKDEEQRALETAKNTAKNRDAETKASKASAELKAQILLASEIALDTELDKIKKDAATKRADEAKRLADEAKAIEEKRIEDIKAFNKTQDEKALKDLSAQGQLKVLQTNKDGLARFDALQEQNNIERDIALQNIDLTESERQVLIAEYAEKEKQIQKDKFAAIVGYATAAASAALDIANNIGELNAIKNANEIKDVEDSSNAKVKAIDRAEKEGKISKADAEKQKYAIEIAAFTKTEALRKKQFENDKKFKIATAIISGATGIANAFATSPLPIAIAQAAVIATTTGLQIAKIKETKFDSGTPPDAPIDNPNISNKNNNGPSPEATAFNPNATAFDPNTINKADASAKDNVKVYVTEADISKTQKKVSAIEALATF